MIHFGLCTTPLELSSNTPLGPCSPCVPYLAQMSSTGVARCSSDAASAQVRRCAAHVRLSPRPSLLLHVQHKFVRRHAPLDVHAVAAPPVPVASASRPKALAEQDKSLQKPTVVITGELHDSPRSADRPAPLRIGFAHREPLLLFAQAPPPAWASTLPTPWRSQVTGTSSWPAATLPRRRRRHRSWACPKAPILSCTWT